MRTHAIRVRLAVVLTALISASAPAQSPDSLDGQYTVYWKRPRDGRAVTGDLKLAGNSGTFTVNAPSTLATRSNPCMGRSSPVTLDKTADGQLVIAVHASQIIPGCPNSTLTLRAIGPGQLKGYFGSDPDNPAGAEITATRR